MSNIIEPYEYFERVKSSINTVEYNDIISVQNRILVEIQRAKDLNQVVLANDLMFTYRVTQKELMAFANGFNRYVSKDVVKQFVDKIEPIETIKVTNLERYPRIIPDENAEIIKKAQELGIFDSYAVIFTDLENSVKHTATDQEFIERNKDPIVLGYFYNKEYRQKYDRYYVITDWIDEYCDLTFDSMVRKISELKIETNDDTLGEINMDEIQDYISNTMADLYGKPRQPIVKEKPKKSFFDIFKKKDN